jgi:hypothetical protein
VLVVAGEELRQRELTERRLHAANVPLAWHGCDAEPALSWVPRHFT